jgi:hypothetical protein
MSAAGGRAYRPVQEKQIKNKIKTDKIKNRRRPCGLLPPTPDASHCTGTNNLFLLSPAAVSYFFTFLLLCPLRLYLSVFFICLNLSIGFCILIQQ